MNSANMINDAMPVMINTLINPHRHNINEICFPMKELNRSVGVSDGVFFGGWLIFADDSDVVFSVFFGFPAFLPDDLDLTDVLDWVFVDIFTEPRDLLALFGFGLVLTGLFCIVGVV